MLSWLDGSIPSLNITDISAPGAIMNFKVGD